MMLTDYEWQAIELSLKVSITSVIFSLPLGILAAWVLVRCRFPGKSLLDSIIAPFPVEMQQSDPLARVG